MIEDLKLSSKLLGDFQTSLEKRSSFFLAYKALPVVLDWRFNTWQKEMEFLDPKDESKRETWSEYNQLRIILVGIFEYIQKRIFAEGNITVYGFFDALVKHVEKFKGEQKIVNNINRYYAKEILPDFYRNFFDEVTKIRDRFNNNIWERFPYEWLVTLAGIKENSIVQKVTLEKFTDLLRNKLWVNSKNEYDPDLDYLAKKLFPETLPEAWAAILTFVFKPWMNDDRMKGLIEEQLTFGSYGRPYAFSGDITDEQLSSMMFESQDQQLNSTVELALILFKSQFTLQSLNQNLEELKNLSYQKHSAQEFARLYFIKLWENIKQHLEKAETATVGS